MANLDHSAERGDKLKKLAVFLAHGVNQTQAGSAVGFSPAVVTQLLGNSEFQALVSTEEESITQGYIDINQSYDTLERKALSNLESTLKYSQDPDLNLRIAMLANKATRRGTSYGNHPLNGAAGGKVVLNLSLSYVNMVNGDKTPEKKEAADDEPIEGSLVETTVKKVNNFLNSGAIQDMMGKTEKEEITGLSDLMPEMFSNAPG